MKMAVFWVLATCNLVEVYRRFRYACCLRPEEASLDHIVITMILIHIVATMLFDADVIFDTIFVLVILFVVRLTSSPVM
jgi:hypothetical protein